MATAPKKIASPAEERRLSSKEAHDLEAMKRAAITKIRRQSLDLRTQVVSSNQTKRAW